jgi:hypothetical protein
VTFCRKERLRSQEDEFFDDDVAPCATFWCNLVLVPVCLLLLVFHITITYQAVGTAVDYAKLTPPGTLYPLADADGVVSDMHMLCQESADDDTIVIGLPTVVLESAINAPG